MKIENFILINLNQNISKARQAAYKGNRDKWIIFGLLCFIFVGLIGWFFTTNSNYNMLIEAREETIRDIKEETRNFPAKENKWAKGIFCEKQIRQKEGFPELKQMRTKKGTIFAKRQRTSQFKISYGLPNDVELVQNNL